MEKRITDPDTIGCGHLKFSMTRDDEYKNRADLVKNFLTYYYKLVWEKDERLKLVVLDGSHEEKAVCVYETSTNSAS